MLYSPSQRSMMSSCRKFPAFFSMAVGPSELPGPPTEVRHRSERLPQLPKLEGLPLRGPEVGPSQPGQQLEGSGPQHTVERQLHKTHFPDLRSGCPLEQIRIARYQVPIGTRYPKNPIASFLEMPLGHNQVLPQLLTSTSRTPEVSPSCNAFGSRARCSFATTLCGPWGKTSRSRSDTTLPFWKEAG